MEQQQQQQPKMYAVRLLYFKKEKKTLKPDKSSSSCSRRWRVGNCIWILNRRLIVVLHVRFRKPLFFPFYFVYLFLYSFWFIRELHRVVVVTWRQFAACRRSPCSAQSFIQLGHLAVIQSVCGYRCQWVVRVFVFVWVYLCLAASVCVCGVPFSNCVVITLFGIRLLLSTPQLSLSLYFTCYFSFSHSLPFAIAHLVDSLLACLRLLAWSRERRSN